VKAPGRRLRLSRVQTGTNTNFESEKSSDRSFSSLTVIS
jgi:hypothetical protein